MRVAKLMLAVNSMTFGCKGVIVWLTVVKALLAILGLASFVGCFAGLG